MRQISRRWILATLTLAVLAGCTPPDPLARLREQLARYPQYSVILQDMKTSGSFSTDYYHQYRVVNGQDDQEGDVSFTDDLLDWERVGKKHYQRYEPYLGMVILSKDEDGQVTGAQFPPGYQYVGNERYGRWRTSSSGGSFWEFYGKYALMSHMFGTFSRPVYRDDWGSYRTTRGQGRPYFGKSREFGTGGSHTKTTNPTFFERQKARQRSSGDRFSNKVRDRTKRSSMSGSRSRSSGRGGK
ncbi:MAG: hypothetical protein GY719_08255 [bacterium]|nr:hypothetical protein [bacterium]